MEKLRLRTVLGNHPHVEEVREAGLTPWSASGTTERQGWIADLADDGVFGPKGTPEFARSADWRTEADRILARVKS